MTANRVARQVISRLQAADSGSDSGSQVAAEATVIFDCWISEHMAAPERADAALRQHGFSAIADRLVELFGPEWWKRLDSTKGETS